MPWWVWFGSKLCQLFPSGCFNGSHSNSFSTIPSLACFPLLQYLEYLIGKYMHYVRIQYYYYYHLHSDKFLKMCKEAKQRSLKYCASFARVPMFGPVRVCYCLPSNFEAIYEHVFNFFFSSSPCMRA